MKKIEVSVIILSYNTRELLRQCLESVISDQWSVTSDRGSATSNQSVTSYQLPVTSHQLPVTSYQLPATEIIVVDNGSTDGSQKVIKSIKSKVESEGFKLTLIENKENVGFAKGNNQGVKITEGKYLLFLNSDTIIEKGAIGKLVQYLENYPKIAAVSPLLLNKDGSIQKDPCYLKFPSLLAALFYYNRFLKILAEKFFPSLLYSTLNFKTPSPLEQLPGAAFMVRKKLFEKIGGFDESFSHFFEDVDLSFRLRQEGNKLYLAPEAKVVHLGRKSLESKIKNEGVESLYYLNFKSLFRFYGKNYSLFNTLLIKTIIFGHLFFRLRFGLIKRIYFQ